MRDANSYLNVKIYHCRGEVLLWKERLKIASVIFRHILLASAAVHRSSADMFASLNGLKRLLKFSLFDCKHAFRNDHICVPFCIREFHLELRIRDGGNSTRGCLVKSNSREVLTNRKLDRTWCRTDCHSLRKLLVRDADISGTGRNICNAHCGC